MDKFYLLTLDPPGASAFASRSAADEAHIAAAARSGQDATTHYHVAEDRLSEMLKAPFSAAQMVAIYNTLPGVRSTKKFTDRDAMARRVLEGLRALPVEDLPADPLVVEQPLFLKREAPATGRGDPEEEKIVMPKSKSKGKTAAKRRAVAKGGNKTELVLGLLRRAGGATAEQIMKATEWQRHSVRGFLSTLASKRGIKVKHEDGDQGRIYKVAA